MGGSRREKKHGLRDTLLFILRLVAYAVVPVLLIALVGSIFKGIRWGLDTLKILLVPVWFLSVAAFIGLLSLPYFIIVKPTARWLRPKLARVPAATGRRLLLGLTVAAWVSLVAASGLLYYANHHFPRGPYYPTGDIEIPDYGRPYEVYMEDMRGLSIPGWAKFFKRSDGQLLWIGLLVGSVALSVLVLDKMEKSRKDRG